MDSFQNREIKRLQCQKSKLVTNLFKMYRNNRQSTSTTSLRILIIKEAVKEVNQALRTKSYNTTQSNKI